MILILTQLLIEILVCLSLLSLYSSPPVQDEEVLDEQVSNIIADQHFALPPTHAFTLDEAVAVNNDEGGNVGEPNDEEGYVSELHDEEENASEFNDEEENVSELNDEGKNVSGLNETQETAESNGDDEGGYIGDVINDEEYQANEFGVNDNTVGKNNKYWRSYWKIGFLAAFILVIIFVAAGVGGSRNKDKGVAVYEEGGGLGETASVIVVESEENKSEIANENESGGENETVNDVVAAPPPVCLSKQSFETAMADEVELYSCNLDKQCASNSADLGACGGNTGTICDGACNSDEACTDNQGDIQSCSCLGNDACNANEGDVGLLACNGKHACKKNTGTIGTLSCNGSNRACFDNNGGIAPESCNGVKACWENDGAISFKSCNEMLACHENIGPVAEKSCNGRESCLKNSGAISAKSW